MDSKTELKKAVDRQAARLRKAEREQPTLLGQTVYLGTLGVLLVLPVVIGAYLGLWLDRRADSFSTSWTISLILVGVLVGAVNVYFFIRD